MSALTEKMYEKPQAFGSLVAIGFVFGCETVAEVVYRCLHPVVGLLAALGVAANDYKNAHNSVYRY